MLKNKSEISIREELDVIICPKKGKIAPNERENNIFIFTLALVFALLLFFVGYVPVRGTSMLPTIKERGDSVIVIKHLIVPDYTDMVIVDNSKRMDGTRPIQESEHDLLIKRVVAKGGDTVSLLPCTVEGRENEVVLTVNGVIVDEPYIEKMIVGKMTKIQEEITVPEGYVYVLGDNRKVSLDSRAFGPVKVELIDGVVAMGVGSGGIRLY